jgi:hypothetical protein
MLILKHELLSIVNVLIAAQMASALAWKEVVSQEGAFAVQMPGEPSVSTYGGEVLMSLEAGGMAFLVTTFNRPPFVGDALARLERAKKQSLEQAKAAHMTLTSERKVSLAGIQGIELRLSDSGGAKHITRFYFNSTRDRLVMVAIRGLPTLSEDVAKTFLESFRFRAGPRQGSSGGESRR